MSIKGVLREMEQQLIQSYESNLDSTRSLQKTLVQDILPGLADELGLKHGEKELAELWLSDLQSLYRLLRRHKFTVSFALENARDVLLWRLTVIPVQIPRPLSPFLRCLPFVASDPFGRPVVVLKLSRLFDPSVDVRSALVHYVELLRLHLEALNAVRGYNHNHGNEWPLLQYVAMVDIGGLSVQNVQNVDLITWLIYELLPRFPGMLAAVFVLNYSWAHSGVWNIVKRALPKSALSRVFFPSQEELLDYFPSSSVPRDYGGSLSPLSDLEDPLENYTTTLPGPPNPTSLSSASSPPDSADQPTLSTHSISRVPSITPTSHLNPYFGYPVSGRGVPTPRLRHGRQRKRDLLRTLAALWWRRWKHHVVALLCLILAVVSYRLRRHPRALKWRQRVRHLLRPPVRP